MSSHLTENNDEDERAEPADAAPEAEDAAYDGLDLHPVVPVRQYLQSRRNVSIFPYPKQYRNQPGSLGFRPRLGSYRSTEFVSGEKVGALLGSDRGTVVTQN